MNKDGRVDVFLSESQYGGSNSTSMLIQNADGKFIDTGRTQLSAQVKTDGDIATVLRGPSGIIYFVFETQTFGGGATLSISAFTPR